MDLHEPHELVRLEVKRGERRVGRGDVPPRAPQRTRERHGRHDAALGGALSPGNAVEVRDRCEAPPSLGERVERRLPRPGGHHDHARRLVCRGSFTGDFMVLCRVPKDFVGCNARRASGVVGGATIRGRCPRERGPGRLGGGPRDSRRRSAASSASRSCSWRCSAPGSGCRLSSPGSSSWRGLPCCSAACSGPSASSGWASTVLDAAFGGR